MSGCGFTSAGTTYDDEDRLTGFARTSGTFNQSWNLTSVGDWTSVTTSSVAMALGYDFDNKLKTADVDNNATVDVNFHYDALGRRVARQGSSGSFVYVQHDQQTIADYGYGDAPASPTHRYVYASYIDEPVARKAATTGGTIHYYHRNQQYSVTAVTTSAGAVAERYAYTAYGQPTIHNASASPIASSAIGNRYTYTGREWDATLGLYHFRARWMSGLAGRFMGRDPIGYRDGLSIYGYVGGRATSAVDPEGLAAISVTINAFISKLHDKDRDGWIPLFPPRPWWVPSSAPYPENGILGGWYVGTNDRMAGQPGGSKLSKTITIDSCAIGRSPPTDSAPTSSGTKMGRQKNGMVQQEYYEPVTPTESDGVGLRGECKSYWSGTYSGKMPFLYKTAPNIEVSGEVLFVAGEDSVSVFVELNTSGFPDFEVLVDGPCSPTLSEHYSSYTHPLWGLSYTNWIARQTISSSFQCSAKTRKCCGGSCGR